MEHLMNFKIKNFGPINNGDIDLGKINIVGGYNSTGKSTASKLLYCFLKANSNKRQDFAYESMIPMIRSILGYLNKDFRFSRRTRNMDFLELIEEYEKSKENYLFSGNKLDTRFIEEDIEDLDTSLEVIQENDNSLYLSIIRNLLQNEFLTNEFDGSFSLSNYSEDFPFEYGVNFIDYDFDSDSAFTSMGSIDVYDVYYIDSFSIFDLGKTPPSFRPRRGGYYDHVDYLRLMLRDTSDESKELFDDKKNKNIISVEKKVKQIIGGKIEFNRGRFTYIPKDSEPCVMQNTASGIKQIGVIQLLLSNRKLKKDSFLIIDEPEVNLHPDWQFKFAEILTLLVKELNISIYINTHSPMFIEAIEVFSKYYDLLDDTFYYLTKPCDDSTGFYFKYIDVDDLYELYDNLSDPYTSIERFRIKSKYNK